jgi:hypothetical protein
MALANERLVVRMTRDLGGRWCVTVRVVRDWGEEGRNLGQETQADRSVGRDHAELAMDLPQRDARTERNRDQAAHRLVV